MERIDRRTFARHNIDLMAEVRTSDAMGKLLIETTILCDVSGGGVRLCTRQEDHITTGQEVEIEVILPQIQAVGARMTATGCVVRISPQNKATGAPATVAVRLDSPLRLHRDALWPAKEA